MTFSKPEKLVKFTKITILNEITDLSSFNCSNEDALGLNDFIHNEAWNYQKAGKGVTHLFWVGEEIVGYVTLSMSSIKVKHSGVPKFKLSDTDFQEDSFPALRIGRLAVHNNHRRNQYGLGMIDYCINFAKIKTTTEVGCKFIVLVTKKDWRRDSFYSKRRFREVTKLSLEDNSCLMYFRLV